MAGKKAATKKTKVTKKKVKRTALTMTHTLMEKIGDMSHFVPMTKGELNRPWPAISTGVLSLDYAFGGPFNSKGQNSCPGTPRGGILNVWGAEHSGKTSLALHICAENAQRGGCSLYVDYEHILDLRYAARLGVPVFDPDLFGLYQPETLEQGVAAIILAASSGVDLIVLDSVGAAEPTPLAAMGVEAIAGGASASDSGGGIALQARAWGLLVPKIMKAAKKGNTAIIALAQTRSGMGKTVVQGGNSWKFYSAIRAELYACQGSKTKEYDPLTHKVKDKVVGSKVQVTIRKSKVSPTNRWQVTLDCVANYGFDALRDVASIAKNHGIINRSGAWFTWQRKDGTEIKVQSWESFIKALRKAPKAKEELMGRVRPLLKFQGSFEPAEGEVSVDGLEDANGNEDAVEIAKEILGK